MHEVLAVARSLLTDKCTVTSIDDAKVVCHCIEQCTILIMLIWSPRSKLGARGCLIGCITLCNKQEAGAPHHMHVWTSR